MRPEKRTILLSLAFIMAFASLAKGSGPPWMQSGEMPWQKHKKEKQDLIGGVPPQILAKQSNEIVTPPSLEEATAIALRTSEEAALPLISTTFHVGNKIIVPDDYPTIQGAIDSAASGDAIIVKPGVYYELLIMKDGVRLVSDSTQNGDEPSNVPGAKLKLPLRTLRTIVDGSKSEPSARGMVDFNPGLGRNTIIDGFTFRNLPEQNHHIPGHAHGLNVRGASPVIMNCLIENIGSTGIGNHVVFADQEKPINSRDFRWTNVKHQTSAVIYRNIIFGSLGLGIGCNHFAAPQILGNEIFNNSDEALGEDPTPGIGAKHGATPTIIGNIVHDNPGGGILSSAGEPQGQYPIDRPTQPTVKANVVFKNGNFRPAISNSGGGSEHSPVIIEGNFIFNSGAVGIGLSNGSTGIIQNNLIAGVEQPGIVINRATAVKLNGNKVTGAKGAGFLMTDGANVLEMIDNASNGNKGPRFVLKNGSIEGLRDAEITDLPSRIPSSGHP